jgi:RHS repeat-associated protein
MTGLDYAVNRHYDSPQGRFTQVDPIEMRAVSLDSPQSLNLYNYCGNDPINHTDPSGLIFGWLKRLFQRVVKAAISAAVAFAQTFLSSGFNVKAAIIAGLAEFGKALLTKPTFSISPTTPGFNPNATRVTFGGPGVLNRSLIIYNLTSLPNYARSVYLGDLGKKLTTCINQIFNKYVPADKSRNGKAGLGKDLLKPVTIKNAPKIIFEARGSFGGTKPEDGINGGPRGVIRIDPRKIEDKWDPATGRTVSRFEVGQRVYVHELGNNLASRVVKFDHLDENLSKYGKDSPTLNLNYFGNQNDPGGRAGTDKDTDTGAALERCVFGDVFP